MWLHERIVGQKMLSQADGLSQLAVMRCLRTAVWIKQSQQLDAERTYATDIASGGGTPSSMPKRPAAAMEAAPAGPAPLRPRPAAALAATVGAAALRGAAVRRRLRGKQPAGDYMERPSAPARAEPAALVDDGKRSRKLFGEFLALAPSPQELLEFCTCTAQPLTSHGHLIFAMFKSSLVVTQKQLCWNKRKHAYVAVVVYDVVYHRPQTDG